MELDVNSYKSNGKLYHMKDDVMRLLGDILDDIEYYSNRETVDKVHVTLNNHGIFQFTENDK